MRVPWLRKGRGETMVRESMVIGGDTRAEAGARGKEMRGNGRGRSE